MRISAALILVLLPEILSGQTGRVETAGQEPRIVVTATRTARISPDRATLYVTVEGTGESPAEAAQRSTQKLQSVTSAIRAMVPARDAINTVPYGVSPATKIPGYPGSSSQASFLARYVIRVQPARLDQIASLGAAALAAGASGVAPPTFEASGADSVRRLRYAEALAQARRDAEALAAALGATLGSIVEVSTTGAPARTSDQPFVGFMGGFDYPGPIQPPDVLVTATVTVRYRFSP